MDGWTDLLMTSPESGQAKDVEGADGVDGEDFGETFQVMWNTLAVYCNMTIA